MVSSEMDFASPEFGTKFRDWVRRLVRIEIARNRPPPDYGVVTEINHAENFCMVETPGDDPRKVNFGLVAPSYTGQIIRISGPRSDRYVDGIVSSALHEYPVEWDAEASSPSIENGSLTGRTLTIGNLCYVEIKAIFGSLTSFGTGAYSWSLPFEASGRGIFQAVLENASSSAFISAYGIVNAESDIVQIRRMTTDALVTSSSPFGLADGDRIDIQGWYPVV